MTASPLASVESAVGVARRRLVAQLFLNRLAAGWAIALVLSLVWFLAESLETHLRALLRAGHCVAICESEDSL